MGFFKTGAPFLNFLKARAVTGRQAFRKFKVGDADVRKNQFLTRERYITNLTRVADTLYENSIIDSPRRNGMVEMLEEMVTEVKLTHEQETAQFATFLTDFKTNIADLYPERALILLSERIAFDDSITRLSYLISDVSKYRGNPMKVGNRWVDLLLCEGALEHLIESLDTERYNEPKNNLEKLLAGVNAFLEQYEAKIHAVIEQTITKNAGQWFQQLYTDYKSMIEIGKPPNEDCYGPVTNMHFATLRLFCPSRFIK